MVFWGGVMVKRKQPEVAEGMKDWQGFLQELQSESDRGAALVGAAFLDEHLRLVLERFFIDDKRKVNNLLSHPERPLGSFGARISIAYCLGMMPKNVYHDLNLIKDIRNGFAHHLHGLSFANEWVVHKCHELELPRIVRRLAGSIALPRDCYLPERNRSCNRSRSEARFKTWGVSPDLLTAELGVAYTEERKGEKRK
jgi:hypothetical protein